jgi:hypothetical protein
MSKWQLDDAMLNEMWREVALEAEQEADHMGKVCELAQMLMPVVVDMQGAGGKRPQICAVLQLAMDILQCRSEQEVAAKVEKLRWEGRDGRH